MKMDIIRPINKDKQNGGKLDPFAILDGEIKKTEGDEISDYKRQLIEYQNKITPLFIKKKKIVDDNWEKLESVYKDLIKDDTFKYLLSMERSKLFEEYPIIYLTMYNKYILSLIKEAILITAPILDISEGDFREKVKKEIYNKLVLKSGFYDGNHFKTKTLNLLYNFEHNPNIGLYKKRDDRNYFFESTNFLLKDLKVLGDKEIVEVIFNQIKPYLPVTSNMEEIQKKLFIQISNYFEENKEYYNKEKGIVILERFKLKSWGNDINIDEHSQIRLNNIISFLKTLTNNNINVKLFEKIGTYLKNDNDKLEILRGKKVLKIGKDILSEMGVGNLFDELMLTGKKDNYSYNENDRVITIKAKFNSKIKSKLDKKVEQLQKEINK